MIRRFFLTCICFSLWLGAADRPNFSGTWQLDEGKSDLTHKHVTKKVQQGEGEITINDVTLKLDGKANAQGVSAKMDGAALVIRTKQEKMSLEERWTLTGNGRGLSISTKASGGPGGAMMMAQNYTKD
jgi:hypothetical protein